MKPETTDLFEKETGWKTFSESAELRGGVTKCGIDCYYLALSEWLAEKLENSINESKDLRILNGIIKKDKDYYVDQYNSMMDHVDEYGKIKFEQGKSQKVPIETARKMNELYCIEIDTSNEHDIEYVINKEKALKAQQEKGYVEVE